MGLVNVLTFESHPQTRAPIRLMILDSVRMLQCWYGSFLISSKRTTRRTFHFSGDKDGEHK
jgi:hypothetical protein